MPALALELAIHSIVVTGGGYAPTLPGAGTVAGSLLGDDTNGVAFGALDHTLVIRDTTTPVNGFVGVPNYKLNSSRNGVALQMSSGGLWEFAPENIVLQSADQTNAAWSMTGGTRALDVMAPDGTLTGTTFTENTATSNHYVSCTAINFAYPVRSTASVWLKAGTRQFVNIFVDASAIGVQATVDTVNWTINNPTATGAWNYVTSSLTQHPTQPTWYLFQITFDPVVVNVNFAISGSPSAGAGRLPSYLGASQTIIMANPQVERYASARPYIPTTTLAKFGLRRDNDPRIPGAVPAFLVEDTRTNLALHNRGLHITHQLTVSGGAGTFTNGETVTATGGGTGTYQVDHINPTFTAFGISNGTGTFTGTLTGGSSGATKTISAVATVWVATSVTAVKDQTGMMGQANEATKLTATGANGTILQTITDASKARFVWCYIKRITGSGVVSMTMDNVTYTTLTVTSGWTAVEIPTQTLANPIIGFKLATSGDAVAVDFVTSENGIYRTSPMIVTTASTARGADFNPFLVAAQFPLSQTEGTLYFKGIQHSTAAAGIRAAISINNNASSEYFSAGFLTPNAVIAAADTSVVQVNNLSAGAWDNATPRKLAAGFKLNDFAVSYNGGAVAPDTVGTMPTPTTQLSIGSLYFNGGLWNGWIMEAMYLPRRMSNAELVSKST